MHPIYIYNKFYECYLYLMLFVQENEESLIVETLDQDQDFNVIDHSDIDGSDNVAVEITSLGHNSVQSESQKSMFSARFMTS